MLSIAVSFVIEIYFLENTKVNTARMTSAIKALKAFRPLRLAKSPVLRDTGSSLIASIEDLTYTIAVDGLFIYVYGILGVQLLCGRIAKCTNEHLVTKKTCLKTGEEWV